MTPPASPDDGAHEGRVETAQSDVPAATFGHYGKQAVNPLALLVDLPRLMPEERFGGRPCCTATTQATSCPVP